MKISKLLGLAGLISLILVIANVVSLQQLKVGFDAERMAYEAQAELEHLGIQLQEASNYLTDQIKNYVQSGDITYYNTYWEEVKETKTREKVIERLGELGISEEYLNLLVEAEKESRDLVNIEEKAMNEVKAGDLDKARNLIFTKNYGDKKLKISELIVRFSDGISKEAEKNTQIAVRRSGQLFALVYVCIFLLIFTIIMTFLMLARKVKSLQIITKRLDELAHNDGDLTSRVDITTKDEIGEIAHSFNVFTEKIQDIVVEIAQSTEQVAVASEELTAICGQSSIAADEVARTIEEIAKGANDQAKDTENGAMNVNILGNIIEQEIISIEDLNKSADTMDSIVNEGFKALEQLNQKTRENNEIAVNINNIITETSKSATRIATASQMINNIAEQTNLLALNASIEAARAGESGRGFSVVADEIRKLAEDSKNFTDEIARVIQDLIVNTSDGVEVMAIAAEIVEAQAGSVKDTGQKFDNISESVNGMKKIVQTLSAQSHEMNRKKEEIISTIENLTAIAEENAAGTEEASASVEEQTASMIEIAEATEQLAGQAESILVSIGRFKY